MVLLSPLRGLKDWVLESPGDDHDHDMDQGPPEPPMVVSPVS